MQRLFYLLKCSRVIFSTFSYGNMVYMITLYDQSDHTMPFELVTHFPSELDRVVMVSKVTDFYCFCEKEQVNRETSMATRKSM